MQRVDALISASARALAHGDALGALQRIALRGDPPALALRGIAMAQLGDFARARQLLGRALRGMGPHDGLACARCQLALAEIALAQRRFDACGEHLQTAIPALTEHGDGINALYAQLLRARLHLLLGRVSEARTAMTALGLVGQPPLLQAMGELISAEIALRELRMAAARMALNKAAKAAELVHISALMNEVQRANAMLDQPCARLVDAGGESELSADALYAILESDNVVVDACRRGLACGGQWQSLASRPVLFALLGELAQAGKSGVAREVLIAHVFRTRHGDETHRARLRVEIGRLRALVGKHARIEATATGYALEPEAGRALMLVLPLSPSEDAQLLALMADGAAWSTSALALALGRTQRSVQRTLMQLHEAQQVRSIGSARARRWLLPSMSGFATTLLLPAGRSIA